MCLSPVLYAMKFLTLLEGGMCVHACMNLAVCYCWYFPEACLNRAFKMRGIDNRHERTRHFTPTPPNTHTPHNLSLKPFKKCELAKTPSLQMV